MLKKTLSSVDLKFITSYKILTIKQKRGVRNFFLTIIFLTIIALLPCFIVLVAAFKFLPQHYRLGSLKTTGICFLLSLATGFALNIALESGTLSGVVAVLVLSFLWAAVLVLINLCLKLVNTRKLPNS